MCVSRPTICIIAGNIEKNPEFRKKCENQVPSHKPAHPQIPEDIIYSQSCFVGLVLVC